MSRNCWENGTIVIPRASWPGFKKNLRAAWNTALDQDLMVINTLHEKLKESYKGKRNVDWTAAVNAEIYKEHPYDANRPYRVTGPTGDVYKFKVMDKWDVARLLVTEPPKPAQGTNPAVTSLNAPASEPFKPKLVLPKKSVLPVANGKTLRFYMSEASITLSDEKSMSVEWNVSENNHAVENARATHIAGVFFKLLDKIQWTRNTGGTIAGNDEYASESRESGGGANYTTGTYGPSGTKNKEMDFRMRGFSAKVAKQLAGNPKAR